MNGNLLICWTPALSRYTIIQHTCMNEMLYRWRF